MRGSAFFTAFLFCVLLASTASGQASSSLRGKVIDAQGGFMPGVYASHKTRLCYKPPQMPAQARQDRKPWQGRGTGRLPPH